MKTEDLKKVEQRGYAKGYNTGHRRTTREEEARRQQDRYDRFFSAALTGLISTSKNWVCGDRKYTTADDYVELAGKFARKAMFKNK